VETFKECGWPGWIILLLGLVSLGVSLLALVLILLKKPTGGVIAGALAALLGLSSIGMGPVGTMLGQQVTDQVLAGESIDPSMRERIRLQGYEEARGCITVGVSLGAVPVLASAAMLLFGILSSRKARNEGG
jgi:hypothetical protein